MKKLLLAAAILNIAVSGNVNAQKCAHDDLLNTKLANDIAFQSQYEQFKTDVNAQVANFEQTIANTVQKTTATVTIPVVFHVVLTQYEINQIGGNEGIYKRAVLQLDALNRDFNGLNPDSTKMHSAFKSRFGKANMYFSFPHRKPDGKGTLGVEIKVQDAGFAGYGKHADSMKEAGKGGLDPWDNMKYLNVWIVNINTPGLLGWGYSPDYANLLGIPEETGVVIDYLVFGQKKNGSNGYISGNDSGRTLVHEMGHFFNLWHIWGNTQVGSGDCTDDDDVSDTPQQEDATHTCVFPTVKPNCDNTSGGEMYMNYMDYAGDACEVMFTKGQVTRMLAQVAPNGPSHELTTHPEIFAWPNDITEIEKNTSVAIYPNPSSGHFVIDFSNVEAAQTVHIINAMGQRIRQINTEGGQYSYTFDLSDLPKGVYTVQCIFEQGTVTRKIVLQ